MVYHFSKVVTKIKRNNQTFFSTLSKTSLTKSSIFTPKLTFPSNVLIANVLRPGSDKWKTHMCSDDAAKLASRVRPELLIIQHFGAKMLKVKPLYEARDIQKASGVRTIAATDGLSIGLRKKD